MKPDIVMGSAFAPVFSYSLSKSDVMLLNNIFTRGAKSVLRLFSIILGFDALEFDVNLKSFTTDFETCRLNYREDIFLSVHQLKCAVLSRILKQLKCLEDIVLLTFT
jgi:hypothetical protein